MKKIRIDDAGHFYLGEFDISPFVISHEVLSDERVSVVLQGDIKDEIDDAVFEPLPEASNTLRVSKPKKVKNAR